MSKPDEFTLIFCPEKDYSNGTSLPVACFYCHKGLFIAPTTLPKVLADLTANGYVDTQPRICCAACGANEVRSMKGNGHTIELRPLSEKQRMQLKDIFARDNKHGDMN